MNNSYDTILGVLKAYVKNKDYLIDDNVIEWEDLIQKSNEHQISALIYYCLGKKNLKFVPKNILNKWKQDIFTANVSEMTKMNRYKDIINGILNINVKLVVLKGTVLKKYYPKMELRTMGDLDILVHEDDFQKVKDYLLQNNFIYINKEHPVHAIFYNKYGLRIEVHWKLINNNNYIADTLNYEKYIWKELIDFDLNGVKVNMLNKENFLLHLCIHMAKHLRNSGFGLRQLFDVIVFCKAEENNIDWNIFEKKARECGALKFIVGLFILIDKVFEVTMFEDIIKRNKLKDYNHQILLKEILLYNKLDKQQKRVNIKSQNYCKRNIIRLIFPKAEEIKNKYPFVKNKYMLPFAWVDRIAKGVIGRLRNLYINNKFKSVIRRRKLLLNQFEL